MIHIMIIFQPLQCNLIAFWIADNYTLCNKNTLYVDNDTNGKLSFHQELMNINNRKLKYFNCKCERNFVFF